ncbi:hypothetical protein C8J57DRAFT_1237036 [Mycena rebaudengoi]|nr:hypothetical protein C8J57DRAFT_1237036 [Mycena rebaudengoi]
MVSASDPAEHIGILPSKANGGVVTVDQGEAVLNIARDSTLHKATVQTLESWNIGDAVDGFMKCVDVGVAAAERQLCFYSDLLRGWTTSRTAFSRRSQPSKVVFYARQPQLHPVLDCLCKLHASSLRHYEPYVADAMIMSSCTFIDGSCLEGSLVFYSFACFPKEGSPDVVDYVQAIPEILIFTNFLNDVLRQALVRICSAYSPRCGDETVAVAKRAAVILQDAPAALKVFKEYEQGYITDCNLNFSRSLHLMSLTTAFPLLGKRNSYH